MTVTVAPTVKDGCLTVRGKTVLSHVPGNVVVSPVGTESAFLGATLTVSSSRHVFDLGILQWVSGFIRLFLCLAFSPSPEASTFVSNVYDYVHVLYTSLSVIDFPNFINYWSLNLCRGYKLLSLFRVKIWWMIPRLGRSASDVPMETQLLLLLANEESELEDEPSSDCEEPATDNNCYILFLPVLDGQFRATLQGTQSNHLQFCIESGS